MDGDFRKGMLYKDVYSVKGNKGMMKHPGISNRRKLLACLMGQKKDWNPERAMIMEESCRAGAMASYPLYGCHLTPSSLCLISH
jgi:hypothetical protein